MSDWNIIPSDEIITKTIENLKGNGIDAVVVTNATEAKAKALEMIPEGSEVMTMASVTLETIGLDKEFNESGKYDGVKTKLYAMDPKTQKREQKKLGASPEYAIGSIHALTQDGHAIIASNTGSQIPGYVYGSDHVIFVVGAQKIVPTVSEGMKRIEEYVLPLETEHVQKAFGWPGSAINKLLIIYKEIAPERITIIIVKEILGF